MNTISVNNCKSNHNSNYRPWLLIAIALLPGVANAQDFTGEVENLQGVLDNLYDDMLPLCSQLIDVSRGIAAFGAMWYIAGRVWRNIANAEPIDFYPLLRPFALGLAILLFPYVIAVMNGVLQPTVTGTAAMLDNSNNAIAYLLQEKEDAIKKTVNYQLYGDDATHGKYDEYTNPDGEEETGVDLINSGIKFMMAKAAYAVKNSIKLWLSEILHLVYEAAALCINTIRTFYLIVLAILGPLVFGLSVFDGLQNSLMLWIARYINVFLWLPVANLFGSIIAKIQENMLRIDITQIQTYGDTFFSSSDTAYIIFLIIGIIGYFTVPSVANHIIHAGGGNMLLNKATNLFTGTAHSAGSMAMTGASAVTGMFQSSPQGSAQSGSNAPAKTDASQFQHDKLAGNKPPKKN